LFSNHLAKLASWGSKPTVVQPWAAWQTFSSFSSSQNNFIHSFLNSLVKLE